jgi:hypothetical protein
MQILFLSNWFPYPPDNGSKLRIYGLLRGLAQKHAVTLLKLRPARGRSKFLRARNDLCQRCAGYSLDPYRPQKVDALVGLFNPNRLIRNFFSKEMARRIQVILLVKIDLVIASQLGTAKLSCIFSKSPVV